jgi:hypothetical protein
MFAALNRESPDASVADQLGVLCHRLNNQLGVILANAELLENRLVDEPHRARAGQLVTGTLDAITTAQKIRQVAESAFSTTD